MLSWYVCARSYAHINHSIKALFSSLVSNELQESPKPRDQSRRKDTVIIPSFLRLLVKQRLPSQSAKTALRFQHEMLLAMRSLDGQHPPVPIVFEYHCQWWTSRQGIWDDTKDLTLDDLATCVNFHAESPHVVSIHSLLPLMTNPTWEWAICYDYHGRVWLYCSTCLDSRQEESREIYSLFGGKSLRKASALATLRLALSHKERLSQESDNDDALALTDAEVRQIPISLRVPPSAVQVAGNPAMSDPWKSWFAPRRGSRT